MRITKKQARETWDSVDTIINSFVPFEAYWKKCEEINAMSEEDYQAYERQVLDKPGIKKEGINDN